MYNEEEKWMKIVSVTVWSWIELSCAELSFGFEFGSICVGVLISDGTVCHCWFCDSN